MSLHARSFAVLLGVTLFGLAPACGGTEETATDTAPPADTATTPDTAAPPDTAVAPDTAVVPESCGPTSPSALLACVEASRLEADLAEIVGARPAGTARNAEVRAFLAERLGELGFTVEIDDYGRGVNVVGTRVGASSPDEVVVVSAHHDSVPNCPGADDNGSGVVGALEAARVLATAEHDRTLVIAFWDEEEKGLLGAFDWTDRASRAGRRIVASFVLEMIGYRSDEPGSQSFPAGFDALFADAAVAVASNDNRGDFIALIADDTVSAYVDAMTAAGAALGHTVLGIKIPSNLLASGLIGDLHRSDHSAFWAHGWPAMMITDTANFRNPNYHCAAAPDAITDIDFGFAANNTAITIYAAALALSDDGPTGGVSPTPPLCDLIAQTGCPEGRRCTLHPGGANWFQPACVSVADSPGQRGDACDRPTNIVGEDTCDAGLFCTFWGLPAAATQARWCRDLCVADEDCPAGERCQALLGAAPGHGACIPECDPFAADACPEGANCIGERAASDRTAAFGCARLGVAEAGQGCNSRSDGCGAGMMCAPSRRDGVGRCGVICDDAHPCLGVLTCEPLPNPPANRVGTGLGTCH